MRQYAAPSVALSVALAAGCAFAQPEVTFRSLLREASSLAPLAEWPNPPYQQMQASSYNRASTKPDAPGWFADSDGTGFIREETIDGRHEWVAMEHAGPGCITRMWAPYFYYDFGDRRGPVVRIYLDGAAKPTIEARWIELLTGGAWPDTYGPAPKPENTFKVPAPLARFTARAGDCYLPIPFAKSCRVTFDKPPFYNIINWRAYPAGTRVESFTPRMLETARADVEACAGAMQPPPATIKRPPLVSLAPGATMSVEAPEGPARLTMLRVHLNPDEIAAHPQLLRSIVLQATFDGETTIWCPVGDFFGSPNRINPFTTLAREVSAEGDFTCAWVMPYANAGAVSLQNLGEVAANASILLKSATLPFDERSLLFHASWDPDRVQPGDRFEDVNFINIYGRGVLVGDQWTVLNATDGWWGEGDEKITIDGADDAFPDHFGTGTEDYYGWAGGVNPTPRDVFSHPLLANIAVGSVSGPQAAAAAGTTRGFNICARTRTLDAIPFAHRLRFNMEASPGVDQRRPTDRLGYSSVVFWYARPGATSNRPPRPEEAKKPLMSLDALRAP